MSYVIVWTYEVASENAVAFRTAYGPDGDWARLFARAPGFLGVELYADGERYLTMDRWESAAAFTAFQSAHGPNYAALDIKLAHLVAAPDPARGVHGGLTGLRLASAPVERYAPPFRAHSSAG